MKRVKIAASAQSDLDEIWLFIANDNRRAADRFHDLLHSKFVALAKQPLMGRARDDLRPGIRSFPVGNYVGTMSFTTVTLRSSWRSRECFTAHSTLKGFSRRAKWHDHLK
jgi:toxin ParE1/3/4